MQGRDFNIVLFWLITTLIILVLSVLTTGLFHIFQNKNLAQNRVINDLKSQHENNILEAQLEMQELIFQNIAHEIHDNIIHSITLTNLQLSVLASNSNDSNNTILGLIKGLSETISQLNNISKGLNRDVIHQQGLMTAIEIELTRLKKLNLFSVTYNVKGEPFFLDDDKELFLFRILQESIQNIIKHATARTVSISVDFQKTCILLCISDDGVGMPEPNILAGKIHSSGLGIIKRRVELLSGSYVISSANPGTILSILIPV